MCSILTTSREPTTLKHAHVAVILAFALEGEVGIPIASRQPGLVEYKRCLRSVPDTSRSRVQSQTTSHRLEFVKGLVEYSKVWWAQGASSPGGL